VLTDIYGREVYKVFDGKMAGGKSTLTWQIAASSPKLTPGIYFLNWNIDEKPGVKKLIYTK